MLFSKRYRRAAYCPLIVGWFVFALVCAASMANVSPRLALSSPSRHFLLRRDECPDFFDLDSLRPEAEAMLRNAIEVIKTDATGDQAAELLAGLLERLS